MKWLHWLAFRHMPHSTSLICNVCKKDTKCCIELDGGNYSKRVICDQCLNEMHVKLFGPPHNG